MYPAARRHGVSRSDLLHVMAASVGVPRFSKGEWVIIWIGDDPDGREIEIFAVPADHTLKVIHAMPTSYRRRRT